MALQVIEDLYVRRELGLTRYGRTVSADQDIDMLEEAYEEALDLVIYLRAAIEQRKMNNP